jgi:molybdopterin-synthase adenylyltransferase
VRESVALTEELDRDARAHLVRADGQEDICFALWYPSRGERRMTALLHRLVLPFDGEREVHGNAAFNPPYFRRALAEAVEAGAGLALLHSHPGYGWQGMSDDDVRAEQTNAGAVLSATGYPLVGLTLAARDGSWSARVWRKTAPRTYERMDCESVRVVGDGIRVSWHPRLRPSMKPREELLRTLEAWGPAAQADLARLRIGVVGLGSVGSIVAEGLARMGVERVLLLDFDRIERHNLDRVLHATAAHAAARVPKVELAAEAARASATSGSFDVDARPFSVCEEDGFRAALDCDVLFSCVDRPWARSVLNFAAYAHLIPVIDGGIALSRTPSGRMRSGEWRAHVASPGQRCLACADQYEPGLVEVERQGLLDDPSYIQQLPDDHPLRANQNVFVFGLSAASLELLQLVLLAIGPGGVGSVGGYAFRFPSSKLALLTEGCREGCFYPPLVARGELAGDPGTGRHATAEKARTATASGRTRPSPRVPSRAQGSSSGRGSSSLST